MKETLVVFINNAPDRSNVVARLERLFKDSICILGKSFDDYKTNSSPKMVLSGESTIERASEYFPDSKIEFISRCSSNLNIEKLIMLPRGTRALVVNSPSSAAIQTIEDIERMGIDHIELIPYWPGLSDYDTNIDTVVYTGYKNLCPPGHSQYINIGYRDINFSVIAKIIQEYDLPPTVLNRIQSESNFRYVKAAYKINSSFHEALSARNNFETICCLSENIIIVTDAEDNISYFNKSAETFFRLKGKDVIGSKLHSVFSEYPSFLRLYSDNVNVSQHVTTLKRAHAVIDITRMDKNSNMKTIISIIPALDIHRRDAQLRKEIKASGFQAKYTFDDIIGNSLQIREAIFLAHQYATSDASIFISGESGTGKELFAQSIHNLSDRNGFPFVSVNCAALPDSLAESELFGYDEGAFTGALKGGKAGKFELAHRGTIFLDEIGDAPLSLQTKLLRVIEEQEVVRISSDKVIPIDVRIICASNKNLKSMVREGNFREDLYYRINVLPLDIPPLKERQEDIPVIATHFFDAMGMPDSELRDFLISEMICYTWPGNVRELRSAVKLFVTLSSLSGRGVQPETDRSYWHNVFKKYFAIDSDFDIQRTPSLKFLVLKTIERKSRTSVSFGRGALLKDASLNAGGLTEYRLKKYITEFAENGLISIGSTKQGMRITEKGIDLLQNHADGFLE